MYKRIKFIIYEAYGGLPKEIYILFIAQVINRMGGFVHAFLTFFMTQKLGMTELETGIYVVFTGIMSSLGSLVGGILGDHIGRKATFLSGQGIAALILVPCGFLGNRIEVVYLLIIMSFFSAIVRPVSNAMVADYVEGEELRRSYSLLYLGINVGVSVSPIIAGYLFTQYLHWFFWGDALTTGIAVVLVFLYVKENYIPPLKTINDKTVGNKKENSLLMFCKNNILLGFTFFGVLTSFIYSQSGFTLPLSMTNLFGGETGPLIYGKTMSFNAIVVLVFTIFVTRYLKAFRPITNIIISNVFYMIGFGMMAFVTSVELLYLSIFIWTIGEIIGVTNTGVFVMTHTPETHRSRFSAIIGIIRDGGYSISPFFSGLLISGLGLGNTWLIVGFTGLIASLGMLWIRGMVITKELKN